MLRLPVPAPAAEQLREFRPYRRFFFLELLEPCNGAESRQPPELILIQVSHDISSR
jgi:hypothetical protein